MRNPDCYKCMYRGMLAGDAHSRCTHPVATKGLDPNSIAQMADAFLGKANGARVKLGIVGGGQTWPANFNPAFLQNCEGFQEREESRAERAGG